MNDTALQIVPASGSTAQEDRAPVFLCHNNQDKERVKQIADALELEFGTPFFLDAYAIPTGEAFMPFIENALASCSGCAIFLGANGWGPTHLWEAGLALARYRSEPRFKLIPVVLRGAREEDMRKLGEGRVFQEINWANFADARNEQESVHKLGEALQGKNLPQFRGPARLTPFQIRRDAARWEASKRTEKSILYRGKQLDEARRMAADNPDFVVTHEIQPFLSAAEERQRAGLRWISIGGVSGTVIFFILFAATYIAYELAEQRRLDSLSRQLAMSAGETASVDRAMLVSARASLVSGTPEAQGNLMQQLDTWRFVDRVMHLDSGAQAVALGSDERVFVGTDDGDLASWPRNAATLEQAVHLLRDDGAVTAVSTIGSERWIGREDGAVDIERSTSMGKTVERIVPSERALPSTDRRVLTIESTGSGISPDDRVAIGTASGQLLIVQAQTHTLLRRMDEGDDLRITSLAFDASHRWLAAGTGSRFVLLINLASLEVVQRRPGIEGGSIAVGFDQGGSLTVLSAQGELTVMKTKEGALERERSCHIGGLVASASIDERRSRMAVGDASGLVRLYDLFCNPIGFESLRAHSDPVSALRFGTDDNLLVSASSNGTVAVWNLSGNAGISTLMPAFGPEPSLLRNGRDGEIIAANATTGTARIWTLGSKRGRDAWKLETDLLEETRLIAGADSLDPVTPANDADAASGFQPVEDPEIPELALDATAEHAAWMTRRGMVLTLVRNRKPQAARIVESKGASGAIELSGNGTVLAYVVREKTGVVVAKLDGTAAITKRELDLYTGQRIRSLAVNADGSCIAVGFSDGRIGLFNAETGHALGDPVEVHPGAEVAGMKFTADGLKLISFGSGGGGADRTIVIQAVSASGPLRRLESHEAEGSVTALSIDDTSGMLAAADLDGHVLLWRLRDAHFIASLQVGGDNVPSVLLDVAAQRLVTVSSDGQFLSWTLDPARWIELACAKANRSWRPDEWNELMPDDAYEPDCAR